MKRWPGIVESRPIAPMVPRPICVHDVTYCFKRSDFWLTIRKSLLLTKHWEISMCKQKFREGYPAFSSSCHAFKCMFVLNAKTRALDVRLASKFREAMSPTA